MLDELQMMPEHPFEERPCLFHHSFSTVQTPCYMNERKEE